jgi:SAM-dependent methyltransferase
MPDEEKEILGRYDRREGVDKRRLYSFFDPGHRYMIRCVEREFLDALSRNGIGGLSGKNILDVGCGRGDWLMGFLQYGAEPGRLYGVDIVERYVEEARNRLPDGVELGVGNAERLAYMDGHFDIVTQFVVFTSILDPGMKERLASEMLRVTKPDGVVVWFDFRVDNPKNPDVRGIGAKELRGLFPGCGIDIRSVLLAPPIARKAARVSTALCDMLSMIPPLRTHYMAVIRKPGG